MTGLPAALVMVAGGVAALLLIGFGIWFQISRLGRPLTACADLRTSPGKHLWLSPASTTRGVAITLAGQRQAQPYRGRPDEPGTDHRYHPRRRAGRCLGRLLPAGSHPR